jgi:exoribonuclease R
MYLCIRNYAQGQYSLSTPTTTSIYTEPIAKKWLHGDILNPTTNELQFRDIKNHKSIVGIIDYLNRVRIGMTPRGVPLYNFHPYDPAYPIMVVSSKLKPAENMVAIASLEHWNEKHPRAGIQHVFGPVGNQAAETATLSMGISIPKTPVEPDDEDEIVENHTRHHCNQPWDNVFNIDPPGCEDVDDVMGWRRTANRTEFFIGIVDIAAWVPEESWLDKEAKAAAQTLYVNGKAVEPMFPTYLSAQKASLRADGVKRPVIALIYLIEGDKVVQTEWRLLRVAVNTAYTYESVLENPAISEVLPALLGIISTQPQSTDPHVWVEQAMILYNKKVAEVLKQSRKGILRRHAGTSNSAYTYLAEKTGIGELAFLGSAAGQYVSASTADTAHAGLGLTTYCHASSPLRRYADVVNHRWLKHLVFGFQEPYAVTMAEHLNHRANLIKQFERLIWFLQHLNPDGSITTTQGIVITYNAEMKTAKVYIPDWKRTVRAAHTTTQVYEPGQEVTIRAFSNTKATSIYQRVVCAMN